MNVGGPALQVTGLIEGLDAERFDQRLYAGFVGPDEADHITLRAPDLTVVRVVGLGRSPNPLADLRAFVTLVREMRAFRPHVVHTHTAKAGVLGRLAARVSGVPVTVHTFHGHLLHGYFSPRVTDAVRRVERALAKRTTRLVAVGERVRDDLLEAGIGRPDQYVVFPPGIAVAPPPTRLDGRASLGLEAHGLVVAFVARLTPIKRPDRFIEVVAAVLRTHAETTFVVCGEGDSLASMREAAAPYGGRVRFLGWRADIETVYAAADIVVLTSDNEGMPVALIEAALCGVPAVATRVGSVEEVVIDGETGFVCDADPEALASGVRLLLDDAELREVMGNAARRHANARYSQARLIDDTERLYIDLIELRGTPAPTR